MVNFVGTGKRYNNADVVAAAQRVGVLPSRVRALIEVETSGRGFDRQKRPRILFERHKFYKYVPVSLRSRAVKAGLANPRAGGYGKFSEQYPKMRRAISIDEESALLSASYALGQIMGFNHKLAGHANVYQLIEYAKRGEAEQIVQIVTFVKSVGLQDELRRGDWKGVARGYNGVAYARNKYDIKLARADKKFAYLNEGVFIPEAIVADRPPIPNIYKLGDEGLRIIELQKDLVRLGYEIDVDGDFGPQTKKAVRFFQRSHGLSVDGVVGPKTMGAIDQAIESGWAVERAVVEGEDYPDDSGFDPEGPVSLIVIIFRVLTSILGAIFGRRD